MTPSSDRPVVECDALHRYTAGGVRVPSVTQILSAEGIIHYPTSQSEAERAAVLQRGSYVHSLTELDDNGELDEESVDPRLLGYLEGWRKFRAEAQFWPQERERIVYSPTYRYAGRLDTIGIRAGTRQLCLIDLKTGPIQPWVGLQLAAYAQAYLEETGTPIGTRSAVQVKDDGTYKEVAFRSPDDWHTFAAAVKLRAWKEEHNG